jgi:hypothetical protein
MKRKLDEGGDQTPEVAGQGKHYKLGVVFWLIFGTLVLALLQSPTILECYWVFIAAFVLLRFVVRSVRGKSRVGPGNDITSK